MQLIHSATGKTQLTSQLCLSVQLPRQAGGLGKGSWMVTSISSLMKQELQSYRQKLVSIYVGSMISSGECLL